jgi:hypothetical protein
LARGCRRRCLFLKNQINVCPPHFFFFNISKDRERYEFTVGMLSGAREGLFS